MWENLFNEFQEEQFGNALLEMLFWASWSYLDLMYSLSLSLSQLDTFFFKGHLFFVYFLFFSFFLTEMTSDVPSLGAAIASGNPGPGIQGGAAIVQRAIKRRPG